MGKVRTGLAVSLDGFISGPNDGPAAPMGDGGERLLAWYAGGDTEYRLPGTDMVFKVSAQTAEFLRETRETTRGVGVWSKDLRPHPWVGGKQGLGKVRECRVHELVMPRRASGRVASRALWRSAAAMLV